jgi:hypothetical protein
VVSPCCKVVALEVSVGAGGADMGSEPHLLTPERA